MNKRQKRTIIIGLIIIAAAVIVWLISGGEIFTKTQVLIEKKDALFGTTYKEWQNKFIWGLDLTLIISGITVLVSGVLFFIFKKREIMKTLFKIIYLVLILFISISAQGFEVKASGTQTFSFTDESGRNQATFYSTTPFEEINGLTTDIKGKVTFDVKDFANTLKGEFTIPVASLRTGIRKMENDLRSSSWLDADKYPVITFKITKVSDVQKLEPNKLSATVTGDFTVHGVTKQITTKDTITYLDESEMTRARMPGDLLGVLANFDINLSDFNVEHLLLGKRVSNDIQIKVNVVGTTKF